MPRGRPPALQEDVTQFGASMRGQMKCRCWVRSLGPGRRRGDVGTRCSGAQFFFQDCGETLAVLWEPFLTGLPYAHSSVPAQVHIAQHGC